ncbi:hypothetical protein MTQ24_06370 [Corynebacterium bovis]|uniref:hypothetical protein n=2 Tax=Corynebacterium bovis TaxID=36808 RepID=UPI0031388DF6
MILWLRHVRAPQAVASAFLATLIVALLVAALPMEEGTTLPIRSLWLAMTLSVPVLFLFTVEDDWDRLSVRPVRRRRAALVAVAALSAGVASAVFYPGNMWDSGAAAMLRNCLGLIGAGLLSLAFLPRWMIWVTPTVLGIASMAFSVPAEPGTAMTLWGALRMPGPVHTTGGALDLSWPLCLAVFVAGAAVYVAGVVVPGRLTVARVGGRRGPLPGTRPSSRPSSRRGTRPSSRRRLSAGVRRAMFLPVVAAAVAVALWWTPVVSVGYWGGSLRLLLASYVPLTTLFAAPVACACGVVAGQYRWRSSVAVWETLSDRGRPAVLRSAVGTVCRAVSVTAVVAVAVLAVVCVAGERADGVPWAAVGSDLAGSTANAVASILLVTAGAAVGTVVGFHLRRIWVPPLALIVTFILVVPVFVMIRQQDIRPWGGDATAVCDGVAPTVCAQPRDRAYLPSVAAAVREVYSRSGFRDELPDVVKVVDSASAGPRVDGAPAVGLAGLRGVRAPGGVSPSTIRDDLTDSLSGACRPRDISTATPDQINLPMASDALDPYPEPGSSVDPDVVRESLRKARECYRLGTG